MKKKTPKDQDLIELFKQNENEAFRKLYALYRNEFISYNIKNNSQLKNEDLVDIFQDALVILYHNVINKKITDLKNPKSYIFKIGSNLIFERLREIKKMQKVQLKTEVMEYAVPDLFPDDEQNIRVKKALNTIGKRCRELIIGYYYKGLSFEELSHVQKYSSANTVKSQKHKCIKQLRNLING